ncbi:cytoplasmic protein, partial [Salmonella enterica]|nr:cytoplasmic protein [Salmonella enterica]EAW2120719.1 cytoplasmic protein [Salmonella enterica subsp. enterica]EEK8040867.1 cytoplasmic protein [Salmonella enterica subsp. enterica serovar Javiana]ECP1467276.1 cytoplasmic protein [Salmonella enterica]EEH4877545.1 cytoplasmic protein [Salmonella enterica]
QFIHINSDNEFSPIIRETRVIKK